MKKIWNLFLILLVGCDFGKSHLFEFHESTNIDNSAFGVSISYHPGFHDSIFRILLKNEAMQNKIKPDLNDDNFLNTLQYHLYLIPIYNNIAHKEVTIKLDDDNTIVIKVFGTYKEKFLTNLENLENRLDISQGEIALNFEILSIENKKTKNKVKYFTSETCILVKRR